jgi:small nuclear ribonucleoprotein (snRNP)-like protein
MIQSARYSQLVELKNGETYNGHLVDCDNFMNITLRDVYLTSPDGDKFWKLKEVYIRGNVVSLTSLKRRRSLSGEGMRMLGAKLRTLVVLLKLAEWSGSTTTTRDTSTRRIADARTFLRTYCR